MPTSYEFLIRAQTEASIPRRYSSPFMVSDVVSRLLSMGGGDDNGSPSATIGDFIANRRDEGASWDRQPQFLRIDKNIGFIRLSSGGKTGSGTGAASKTDKSAGSGPGFFFVKPLERPLNSFIGSRLKAPKGAASYDDCEWEAAGLGADSEDWETWLPDNSQHTHIARLRQAPDEPVEVRTKKSFEANRQLRADFQFWGTASKGKQKAAMRAMWADKTFSFFWQLGAAPVLSRWDSNPMVENGILPAPRWVDWHVLEGAPLATFQGDWTLRVLRLNGSIVVTLSGEGYFGRWDFADTVKGEKEGDIRLRDVEWRAGRVGLRLFNVNASMGLALLDYAEMRDVAQNGKAVKKKRPLSYDLERDAIRPATMSADKSGTYTSILFGKTGGWTGNGTKTTVRMETKAPSADTKWQAVVRYKCTLTCSPDGIDTPCVASIFGKYEGAFSAPPPEFLNIRHAALRGSFSSSEPPSMAGSELRLDLSRNLLEELTPDWEAYVHAYHPIELLIRRRTQHGNTAPIYSPWVGRFKGYQLDSTRQAPLVNDWRISLVCEGPAKRLQKPHAIIDHHYYPFDLLYAQGDGRKLFVPECVKEIVNIGAGQAEAAKFNGTGDPMRFVTFDHPPLISTLGDGAGLFPLSQPIVSNGFTFPPPWNQGPLDWIKTLTGIDRTICYSGFLPAFSGAQAPDSIPFPVFICGRYENIIDFKEQNGGIHTPSDALYIPGDELMPIADAQSRFRADFVYNRFLAWSNPEGSKHPLLPALLMAEENLSDDDPNSALHSWERTFVITEDYLYKVAAFGLPLDGVAAAVFLARREFENKDWHSPTLSFRGEPTLDWGDRVTPKMLNVPSNPDFDAASQSDKTLRIAGREFRAIGVDETYEFEHAGPNQYMATVKAAPLSTGGY